VFGTVVGFGSDGTVGVLGGDGKGMLVFRGGKVGTGEGKVFAGDAGRQPISALKSIRKTGPIKINLDVFILSYSRGLTGYFKAP
jgi:hypothetical protein